MLEMIHVSGDGVSLGQLAFEVQNAAPNWFLHGTTEVHYDDYVTDAQERLDDHYHMIIWGEGKFWDGLNFGEVQVDEGPLPDRWVGKVYEEAAVEALKICLTRYNYDKFGEVLLNKYPECRKVNGIGDAIVSAALLERRNTFNEDDYEEP